MVVKPGSRSTNAWRVDFARATGHCRTVVKGTTKIAKWSQVIGALALCVCITCSNQMLPQLIARIALLNQHHGVSLYATSDGVNLVLTHDAPGSPLTDNRQSFAPSPSQPTHVVHIMSVPMTAKQSTSLASNARIPVLYFPTVMVAEWRRSVPPLPFAYSRPPPGEMSISPLRRSTLLLI